MLTNKIGLICLLTATAFLVQSCRESTLYPNRNPDPVTNPTSIAIADVYGVEWELEAFEVWANGSLMNESAVPGGQGYSLTFRQDGLGGDNDCNAYGAAYKLSANKGITIYDIMSTKAYCGTTSRDGDFAGVLGRAIRYDINATTLRIFADDKSKIDFANALSANALRFKRVNAPAIRLAPLELMDLAASDPYSILSTELDGDLLRLTVNYSGGCKDHVFSLMGPSTIPTGDPTPITILLHHNADGDGCEALINRDLVFDLAPLKERWKSVTGRASGTIALTLNDLHSRSIGPMSYTID